MQTHAIEKDECKKKTKKKRIQVEICKQQVKFLCGNLLSVLFYFLFLARFDGEDLAMFHIVFLLP